MRDVIEERLAQMKQEAREKAVSTSTASREERRARFLDEMTRRHVEFQKAFLRAVPSVQEAEEAARKELLLNIAEGRL